MSDTEREKDRKTLGYILKSRSEDMLHDYDDNKVFIFIILRARLDGSNSGAVLMEMLGCCEGWTGAAPCCVCCAARLVRTTLILAAVSSRSSLPWLVSGVCSSTVVVWYSRSSLHSGGGHHSAVNRCYNKFNGQ